jgi:putative Ca2+/H+ antiporter (TMEM165/GDT1 family)
MDNLPNVPSGSNSVISSFLVILVSEIGDKTFLINCIMAMRNPRLVVFSGAMAALALMSILSAALGYTLPQLLSRRVTQWLAALLFLAFGLKMIKEANDMTGDEVEQEMQEVNQELLEAEEADKASRIGSSL